MQTFALGANLLKRRYFPKLVDQLHTQTPELGLLAKTGRSAWGGSDVRIGLRTSRNRSYRPTSSAREQAAFPATGRQGYSVFVVPCVIIHGSGGVTAFGSAASNASDEAFEQMLKAEIQGHIADAQKDLGYDFFRTPLGILGRLSADPANDAETITLEQDPANQLVHWRGEGNRAFSVNQVVEIFSQDGVTRRVSTAGNTSFIIQSVATANRTQVDLLGFANGASVASDGVENAVTTGDLVLRAGTFAAQADPGDNTEAAFAFNGLEQIFADSGVDIPARNTSMNYELDVLQGVDRGVAANSWGQATVVDMNAAVLDRNTLNQFIKRVQHRGGLPLDVLLCEDSVQISIADLMVGDQRYEPQKFPGGFQAKSLLWNAGSVDVPIVPSRECPYDRIYGFSVDAVEQFDMQSMELIETDGSVLRQASTGGDAWNYNWRYFGNMGSRKPAAGGKIVRIGGADEGYGVATRVYDF